MSYAMIATFAGMLFGLGGGACIRTVRLEEARDEGYSDGYKSGWHDATHACNYEPHAHHN